MSPSFQNYLLRIAGCDDLERLKPHLVPETIENRKMIEAAGAPIESVYFIEHGVVSVVARAENRTAEIGLIGREGVTGIDALLGDGWAAHEAYVQVTGEALRIDIGEFREVLLQCPALNALLLRYVQAFMIQTGQTALANAKCKIEERLARWLLMVQDRTGGRHVELTHQFMATMLGTRRAGVTVSLHELEARGLIKSQRGRVTIHDRKGLEEIAGVSYGTAEHQYRRIFGSWPPAR